MSSPALKSALQNLLGASIAVEVITTLDAVEALSGAEAAFLDGVTAGQAIADRALVLDADKAISTITTIGATTGNITTVNATNVDAGASGTAGTVDIFPTTASKGKIALTATANTSNDTITITNAAFGQAATLTIPDPGAAAASFVLTAGAQSLSGNLTLASGANLIFSGTTGQSEITFTDNLADALSIKTTNGAQNGNDFIVFDSTDTDEKLHLAAHADMKLGFFTVTPAVRQSAYTQTYATADKTHADPTAAALTVTDGAGTNDGTIGAITADASVIAAVQELADQINKLVADMADAKQLVNSVIDDLQAYGLLQ